MMKLSDYVIQYLERLLIPHQVFTGGIILQQTIYIPYVYAAWRRRDAFE